MGRLLAAAGALSLRARLTVMAALAVAIGIGGVAAVSYVEVSKQLVSQEDSQLQQQYQLFSRRNLASVLTQAQMPNGRYIQPISLQVVDATGQPVTLYTLDGYPVSTPAQQQVTQPATFLSVASDEVHKFSDAYLRDGTHVRVLAIPIPSDSGTLIGLITRDVSDDDATLTHLRLLLLIAGGIGVLVAAGGGLLVARQGLKPVDRLTAAAEHIARTEELDAPLEVTGSDEVARLAKAFNSMTEALSQSRERQKMLVADAGHELRTPLTSMRTNLDLLIRSERSGRVIPQEDREKLLDDLSAQMAELGTLIGELVNLARDDHASEQPPVEVDFAQVVARAAERVRLRTDGLIETELEPWPLLARPGELERAIVNLLDNAVKFSPAGTPVDVRLYGGTLTVADRGPGVAEEDRPHVFERFYRATSSRGMPGSGLGLAIVAQTVASVGGTVVLEARPGGGTVARMVLPPRPPTEVPPGAYDEVGSAPPRAGAGARGRDVSVEDYDSDTGSGWRRPADV